MQPVSGALGFLASSLLLSWLLHDSVRPAAQAPGDGQLVLRYGRGVWAVGIVTGVLIPAFLVFLALKAGVKTPNDKAIFSSIMGVCLVFGTWFLLEAAATRVILNDTGLTLTTAWRRSRTLAWTDVTEVKFSSGNGWLVLRGRNTVVRVSIMLVGFISAVEAVEAHLSVGLRRKALEDIQRYYRARAA